MSYLIAALVVIPVAALVYGAWRGRIQVRGCCSVDPSRDLRMRGAYDDRP